ncbi:MAG TPA: beta-N-acetylhexosaminidase [Thermomicrobiales bacterium]|jgi:beta-N-acetylhexosaminidase
MTTIHADLTTLPLAAQVGQLIAAKVHGPVLDAEDEALLRECRLGGVVLFADNIGTPEETRALTARIQALCGQPGLPAIIAVDQEGGRVQRLHPPATSFPSAMAIGATGDPEHAHRWGLATARELRALGITMNFAPTLDVNNNPGNPVIGTRSFGERPAEVARFGLAAAAGLREGGMAATGKHFPGHGDTALDSHYALPTIAGGRERLDAIELPPFRAAIAAGIPAIMSSHIVFPDLDPDGLPCTLSPRLLTGLLREELGFQGVIVSDAMNMQAIADRWGVADGAVRFIAAGGDLVEPIGEERAVHAAILAAVERGRIPAARLTDALRRVATLRAWLKAQGPADSAWLGATEHRAWAATIARDAVTLLRDDAGLLPIRRDARIAVLELFHQWTFLNTAERPERGPLQEALAPHFPHLTGAVLDGQNPAADEIAAARALAADAEIIVLGTRATNRFPAQAAFVSAALGWSRPTVAVALADPYDTLAYPAAPTALATYGADPMMLTALGAILVGEETARGRLPVSL